MANIKKFYVIIFFIVLGCSAESEENTVITIMSWNVENFFDDVDNGTEYYEFDPGNNKWNYDCFTRKASAIADVITSAENGGPDIVLLQEVENYNALEYLNDSYLKALSYPYLCFFPTSNSAVGTAVLSRYPIAGVHNHAVRLDNLLCGRNIAEVEIFLKEESPSLVVFINHWKSKLGGAEETEPQRIAASVLLNELMQDAILAGYNVLAAGDFNESYDESSRNNEAYQAAIVCGDDVCDGLNLMSWGSKDEMKNGYTDRYFNPWCELEGYGSYYYNDGWETLDQFFIGDSFFDDKSPEYSSFRIVKLGFNETSQGKPLSWDSGSGLGCSDHFPVILELFF
ncbi:MAG: endonuclease/exonuclease/phosphatase family protein [Spirochaetales bacterium]|nr:endonuclease/exonuclease/phosphatase family protein [Spirochaetales bacterium]